MIFLTSLLRHLRLVNQRQLSFCSHSFTGDKHSAAGYGGSGGNSLQAGLNLVRSFRGLFCVHARESRRKQASWLRSAFQGAITPLTWAAHLASAEAVADIAGEQKSNTPGAVFCTVCWETWSFHIVRYRTISLQCKDKTLWSQARGKVFVNQHEDGVSTVPWPWARGVGASLLAWVDLPPPPLISLLTPAAQELTQALCSWCGTTETASSLCNLRPLHLPCQTVLLFWF